MELNEKFKEMLEKRDTLQKRLNAKIEANAQYADTINNLVSKLRDYCKFAKENGLSPHVYVKDKRVEEIREISLSIFDNGAMDIYTVKNDVNITPLLHIRKNQLTYYKDAPETNPTEISARTVSDERGDIKPVAEFLSNNESRITDALDKAIENELQKQINKTMALLTSLPDNHKEEEPDMEY